MTSRGCAHGPEKKRAMLSIKKHIVIKQLSYFFLAGMIALGSCSMPMKGDIGPGKKIRTHKRKNLKKLTSKNDHTKLHTRSIKQWSVLDLFRDEQKRRELKCPDRHSAKSKEKGKFKDPTEEIEDAGASIKRFTRGIHFDIIELEAAFLDIPAFKQFENNMTNFTADGEEQFKEIVNKIRDYLGDNTNGYGVTLKIIGSASQIPTSYDPSKPNNNINTDGSSIIGQTSIENNKRLAQARAMELAKKIKEIFSQIEIVTPELDEIELGKTVWDLNAQKRLSNAHIRKDEAAKEKVFEPYQKEQFVKVESQESYMKTIKPEAIDMYMVSVRPKIVYDIEDGVEKTISSFIVSKKTYDKIEGALRFDSVEERDVYLRSMDLNKMYDERVGEKRWYLYSSAEELKAIEMENNYDRIYAMYELGIVDEGDKEVLKEIIRDKYLKSHKKKIIHN